MLHILFLAIWTANVFALWKNGPAKASPLGAALGVFFLVWGVGGRGAVWLGRGGMPAGVLGLGLGLLLAFTGVFRLRNVYACRLPGAGRILFVQHVCVEERGAVRACV